jgi:alpha-glucosidase
MKTVVAMALLAGVLTAPAPAAAEGREWTVGWRHGPTAHVSVNNGSVALSVTRDGDTVLPPSQVGIRTEQADLTTGLRYVGRSDRGIREHYTTTVGKERRRDVAMKETRFAFTGAGGARMTLVVRAAADGVAYRYELPANYGAVLGEASAFSVPADATAWLARHRRDYENPFIEYPAGSVPAAEFMTPALFQVGDNYLSIAESDLDGRYSGSRLVHEAGTYRIGLWDAAVAVDGPLKTPWRVMMVGDLATVTESTLVDDLVPRSRVADRSWIKPDQVLWTWLAGGRPAGQSLELQKGYVDYAAQRGWPYVAVDAGWYFDPAQWDVTDPNWPTTSWIPQLVTYGAERGVRIVVWIHFRDLDTPEERDLWLPTLHRWGVAGVKIDFMDSEAQERLRWYDEILPATAANQLLVNFHGSNIPKGIHRTWPHVMTMEGVHGAEKRELPISHVTTLAFTRNVVGSMDYTPEAFHRAHPTSDGYELGLSVLFESGLQNLAGTPASYDERPEARSFLEQVPATWDESRLLAGRPGESVVMARRHGDRWFLGGGVAGEARTLDVPLAFLKEHRLKGRWLLETVHDGPTGLVRDTQVVTGGAIQVSVPTNGGFAAVACRATAQTRTCYR